jgi:hypothetical protein
MEVVTGVLGMLLAISEILPMVTTIKSNGIVDCVIRSLKSFNEINEELAPIAEDFEAYRNRVYSRSPDSLV